MKVYLLLLAFTPCLVLAGESTPWHWRYGSSAWNGWFETRGMGIVNVSGCKIHGSLFDHENSNFQRISFEGNVKNSGTEITVTILASDVGQFKLEGEISSREFNNSIIETMVFSNKWKYLALTRRIQVETHNNALQSDKPLAALAVCG